MTTKEALHHLVDELPEDQTELARVLLEDLRDGPDVDGPPLDAEIARPRPRRYRRRARQAARRIQARTRVVNYRVIVSHEAEKVLDRLDRPTEQRILGRD